MLCVPSGGGGGGGQGAPDGSTDGSEAKPSDGGAPGHLVLVVRQPGSEEPRKRVLWPHVAFATPLSLNGNPGGNSPVEVAMLFKPEAGMLDRHLSWV